MCDCVSPTYRLFVQKAFGWWLSVNCVKYVYLYKQAPTCSVYTFWKFLRKSIFCASRNRVGCWYGPMYTHTHTHITKPTHTHTLQNPHVHTHYKTYSYTHITKPTHTHTLQSPLIHTHYKAHSYTHITKPTHTHTLQNNIKPSKTI